MDMLESHGPAVKPLIFVICQVATFRETMTGKKPSYQWIYFRNLQDMISPQKNLENQFLAAHFHQIWIWIKKRGFLKGVPYANPSVPCAWSCLPASLTVLLLKAVGGSPNQTRLSVLRAPILQYQVCVKMSQHGRRRKMAITKVW